jgi:teichuronic acid biosynthesis glycosyltransferase TuaC
MVAVAAGSNRLRVVAPVPWVPRFVPLPPRFGRYRAVPRWAEEPAGVPVSYPRIPLPPGSALQALEARLAWPAVRREVRKLHAEEPIDVIHAHFIYPDGVVASLIGREIGIPVVTTEHAHWDPWLPGQPAVLRQVLEALPHIRFVTGVSQAVVGRIDALAGGRVETRVLPNVLDESVFRPDPTVRRVPDLLLFVGAARKVKGFDVLVRALPALRRERPGIRVDLLGDAFYAPYRRDLEAALRLADELGVRDAIRLMPAEPPEGVAAAMRRAAVVVVPSRRESFSSVTMEAIACGTPVVATRCGGPEQIIGQGLGIVVEPDDPSSLAEAISDILATLKAFDSAASHADMVRRFGREASAARLRRLYSAATGGETMAL